MRAEQDIREKFKFFLRSVRNRKDIVMSDKKVNRLLHMGGQTPFGQKVAAGLFDPVPPAQSWEMPLTRELPAKVRRCYK